LLSATESQSSTFIGTISTSAVNRASFAFLASLTSLSTFLGCSQGRLLSLLVLLAHQAHACELTSNIIDFHSRQRVLLTYLPNVFSFQHATWLVVVIIVSSLGLLAFSRLGLP